MAQRIYVPFTLFNMRIVMMQHLWEPSREYLGKPTDKPNYFMSAITPKTRQNWWEEPALAPAWAAYSELLNKSGMTAQMVTEWPIKDGDMPPEPGKAPSEWAKGHWLVGGNSQSGIKVEIVRNGNPEPLINKVGVKPGDIVALGLSAAVKQNNPRALKHFCNAVLFCGAAEEIAVGNSVSGAELMRQAQAQGLQVAGFSNMPGGFSPGPQGGGFPGAPQPGFTAPGPQMGGHAAPGVPGFAGSPNPHQPGFTPGPHGMQPQPSGFPQASGPAPTQGGPVNYAAAPTGFPGQGGPQMGSGGAAFPSSGPTFPAGPQFPGQ